jgi:hypothetical protein
VATGQRQPESGLPSSAVLQPLVDDVQGDQVPSGLTAGLTAAGVYFKRSGPLAPSR